MVGCINQENLHAIFANILHWYNDSFVSDEITPDICSFFGKEHRLMNGATKVPMSLKAKVPRSPFDQ